MEIPQTISEFFTWLASAGALGFVVSALAEVFPKWETLDPKVKRWIVLGISAVLGMLSTALIKYVPAGVVEGAQDWYKAIVTAAAVFAASQWSHWAIIRREDRKEPPTAPAPSIETSTSGATFIEPPVEMGNG